MTGPDKKGREAPLVWPTYLSKICWPRLTKRFWLNLLRSVAIL